jgi:hypothetical protein
MLTNQGTPGMQGTRWLCFDTLYFWETHQYAIHGWQGSRSAMPAALMRSRGREQKQRRTGEGRRDHGPRRI